MKAVCSALLTLLLIPALLKAQTPKGLTVGTKAPAFTAADQDGHMTDLYQQLKKGPVVLVFYRGEWCPYCNKQLKQLEDSLSMITGKGASVMAVSPELAENVSKTVSKTGATYSVLHDDGMHIMKMYDVAYVVDEATREKYKSFHLDLDKQNGSNGASLPVPTVYVIDKTGKITFRYFNPDYTTRVSVKEILAHL